ncbi:hypothetical protein ANN_21037 [Periplaneta americana]|uniref:Uncharacterized protein n=1 Tax=Periplaneta americana TaxID=6978 RepID=A0ABQ8SE97_PERAM|nr:hypothetical protein ANN_21037 [Periplaneta americana]
MCGDFLKRTDLKNRGRVCSTEIMSIVRSRNTFAFSSDERAFNIESYFRTVAFVRNGDIEIGDLSFEEVEKFKYLGATVININDTREEIKRRINMRNACYYSVEKLLSSTLL